MTTEEIKKLNTITNWILENKQIQWREWYSSIWRDENVNFIEIEDFLKYDFRVKPEPKYRPFRNTEEALQTALKHNFWLKHDDYASSIISINNEGVRLAKDEPSFTAHTFVEICNEHRWADDGTPCGILVE